MNKKYFKLLISILWLTIIGSFAWYLYSSGTRIEDIPEMLRVWLQDFGLLNAALIYIIAYTIRPIIFFPATLLTLLSGTLFGPILGTLFTIVGENFSANFAFAISRYLGRDYVKEAETGFIKKVDKSLQENGVITTMILRFVYLPFDAVNYGCGLTSMRQRDYAIGTFIGILPGLITFVLLGASASAEAGGTVELFEYEFSRRFIILSLSACFFVLGLAVSYFLKKYSKTASKVEG